MSNTISFKDLNIGIGASGEIFFTAPNSYESSIMSPIHKIFDLLNCIIKDYFFNRFLKYSTVFFKPFSLLTLGIQLIFCFAKPMSGHLIFGSSIGKGS